MHVIQHWGCLCWLYRQYNIAVFMLWVYVAYSPWKCLNSVNAKEECWAEFCACCCHFIFSCWQDKWINTQNNKLRNMNFTLLTDTNTERGFYIKKHLKYTFIIHTTSLNTVSLWQLHDPYYSHHIIKHCVTLTATWPILCISCLSDISELYLVLVYALISLFQALISLFHPCSCRIICYTLVTKPNFISHNSFCWPCCWNLSIVLPQDSPLKSETCQSYAVLIKWC